MGLTAENRQEIVRLYHASQLVEAYRLAQEWGGDPNSWTVSEDRILWGRLLNNLGAGRRGSAVHLRLGREPDPSPGALYFYGHALMSSWGAVATSRFMRAADYPATATAREQSDWASLAGDVAAAFRDFERAEAAYARGVNLDPSSHWARHSSAWLAGLMDQHTKALELSQAVLEENPAYRPSLLLASRSLVSLGREEEAYERIKGVVAETQCASLCVDYLSLCMVLDRLEEAHDALVRVEEAAPLADKSWQKFFEARRFQLAYRLENYEEALVAARKVDSPYYKRIVTVMERTASEKPVRVELSLGFVKQDHLTCAPATLCTLARFFGRETDHDAVAAEICYDGTPDHAGRHWAENEGWVVREFTMTRENVIALIDRGFPFALSTVDPGNAHMQAVMGYDTRKDTLLIRDPFDREVGEFLFSETLEYYASTGPHCTLLVPPERVGELEGVTLCDAELYDAVYRIQRALTGYDRAAAVRERDCLVREHKGHRLTLLARSHVARYDRDRVGQLTVAKALLELHPEDVNFRLNVHASLRGQADGRAALEVLRASPDFREEEHDPHPLLLLRLADDLMWDARNLPELKTLLRKLVQRRWGADVLDTLANHALMGNAEEEALELFRGAACLAVYNEYAAQRYMSQARRMGKQEEALALLRWRFETLGEQSHHPARTLFWAYDVLNRQDAGLAVLEEGLRRRPDDGEFLLYAGHCFSNAGDRDRARELFEKAKGVSHEVDRLRARARMERVEGRPDQALAIWRRILSLEPMATDAHSMVARLLAETAGDAEALAHLRGACDQFPANMELIDLLFSWLPDREGKEVEQVLRRMLDLDDSYAWAWRELACVLFRNGAPHAEVWDTFSHAEAIDPDSAFTLNIRGWLLHRMGKVDAAREVYRKAIKVSADDSYAIGQLLELTTGKEKKAEELRFVAGELRRQVLEGDGLIDYQSHAANVLSDEELEADLRQALEARSDLWQASSALSRLLLQRGRVDEAREVAVGGTGRFPLLPRVWLDLSVVQRAAGDVEGELASLGEALRINPTWGDALRSMAEARGRMGDYQAAREVLEQAVRADPLDAVNHGHLADVLLHLGEREAARESLLNAVNISPAYEWAWRWLLRLAEGRAGREEVLEQAREVTRRRPGNPGSWSQLGSLLDDDALEEKISVFRKVTRLAPSDPDGFDSLACALVSAGQIDAALEACRQTTVDGEVPHTLGGREAWILYYADKKKEAIEKMEDVVAANPQYYWGLRRLWDWYIAAESHHKATEVGRKLVTLGDQDAESWACLGRGLELIGKHEEEALASYRKAVELDPQYEYAIRRVLDLQLAEGDVDEARKWLDTMGVHLAPGVSAYGHLLIASKAGAKRKVIRGLLSEFLAGRGTEGWMIEEVLPIVKRYRLKGVGRREALRMVRADGEVNYFPGSCWKAFWGGYPAWIDSVLLFRKPLRSHEGFLHACSLQIDRLSDGEQTISLGVLLLARKRWLAAHDETWGSVGRALYAHRRIGAAIRWMKGYEERVGVQDWMMANMGMCYVLRGKWGEAARVARFGLGCAGEDSTGILWALIAGERLTEGDTPGFLEAFEKVDWYPVSESHTAMLEPMRVVQKAREKGPASQITIRALKKLAVPTSPYSRRLFLAVRKVCLAYLVQAKAERSRRRRRS